MHSPDVHGPQPRAELPDETLGGDAACALERGCVCKRVSFGASME